MPDPRYINLDVRDQPSNGGDGYTTDPADDGSQYSHRYSGGAGAGGDVIFAIGTPGAVVLTLPQGGRFAIHAVSFTRNDPASDLGQLSWAASNPLVINNRCTSQLNANYKVVVIDTVRNHHFNCDPKIINQ